MSKALEIQNIMNKQDEKDRAHMSLYAALDSKPGAAGTDYDVQEQKKDRKNPEFKKQNTIKLNKSCITCSDNKQGLRSLFKTACLNYESSTVKFEKKSYPRSEIIQLQSIA